MGYQSHGQLCLLYSPSRSSMGKCRKVGLETTEEKGTPAITRGILGITGISRMRADSGTAMLKRGRVRD